MDNENEQQKIAVHSRKRFISKKWVIIGGIVLLVLVAGIIFGWLFTANQESIKVRNDAEIKQLVVDAKNVAADGKTDEAIVMYDEAINKSNNSFEKSALMVSKAIIYLNNSNIDKALEIAKDAETVNQNESVTEFIAMLYSQKNDKNNAIKYYEKTITLADKANPLYDLNIKNYQSMIDSLNGVTN